MEIIKTMIGRLVVCSILTCYCLTQNVYSQTPPPPGGGGTNGYTYSAPPDISNYLKYRAQSFLVLDTNAVAGSDTNLFNALLSFAGDNGTNPVLQVLPYGDNCLLFKASHFDYSGETTRDFCLAVGDKVETPLFKRIDLSNPSDNVQNGGWLVQGSVQNIQVADPMFLMVSNTSRIYNGFFRVVPYGGPQISLSGPTPYDVVSNTISMAATVTDLSGVTNEQFDLTVDGFKARYSIGTNNAIRLETPYNVNGPCTIYVKAINAARIVDPMNPPGDAKTTFSGRASLPLDFENDTYMAFAGDNSDPAIGTTYSLFVINKAQDVEATIYDPSNGTIMAHYFGHVPYAATVEIPWDFTETGGVTPYTNDAYVVKFVAYDPAVITITNFIGRDGVRLAARNILTYEEEDPASGGMYINSQASSLIGSLENGFYENLYSSHSFSTTQYETWQIGSDRENIFSGLFPWVLTQGQESTWLGNVTAALGSYFFSDFTYYSGHCNDTELGGNPPGVNFVVNGWISSTDVKAAVRAIPQPNWRMRKVALWGCYSDSDAAGTAQGTIPSWPQAFGIRKGSEQISGFCNKNAGLFFAGSLPQQGYSGTLGGTSYEVAEQFDLLWVCGPNQYSGGCDPTYAFSWAVAQIRNINPELDDKKSYPALEGFPYLPYAGIYDWNLTTNDVSSVKR